MAGVGTRKEDRADPLTWAGSLGRHSLVVAALAGVVLAGAPALAHTFLFTDVTLRLDDGGGFQVDVVCDLDALALGVEAAGTDSAELAARIEALPAAERDRLVAGLLALLERRLRVRFDDQPAPFAVSLPERGSAPAAGGLPSALGTRARLEGRVPPGAGRVAFFASRAFPPVRLKVVGSDGGVLASEILEVGGTSASVPLSGAGQPTGAVATRFLSLGFHHIVPAGVDHMLFVFGLALLSARPFALLAQVTAFTAAHTLSLALAVYGIASLPSRLVEPLIAASIVYVAIENLFRTEPSRLRVALVFAFGLLHGLGFAGALTELGWPAGRRVLALVSFNLGVELGQLAVIATALVLVALAARVGWPRRRVEQGLSLAIGGVALLWTVQRLVG